MSLFGLSDRRCLTIIECATLSPALDVSKSFHWNVNKHSTGIGRLNAICIAFREIFKFHGHQTAVDPCSFNCHYISPPVDKLDHLDHILRIYSQDTLLFDPLVLLWTPLTMRLSLDPRILLLVFAVSFLTSAQTCTGPSQNNGEWKKEIMDPVWKLREELCGGKFATTNCNEIESDGGWKGNCLVTSPDHSNMQAMMVGPNPDGQDCWVS